MKSSERKMKLILMLQSNNKVSVDDLAQEFGVSRRTVFRDLKSIQEISVPVTWDKYHGYGIMKGYTIPPLMFSTKQLATIMMGLAFVKSQIDESLVEDAKNVELKIKSVLPGDLKDLMNDLRDKTITDPFFINKKKKKKGGDWFTIYSAIAQNKSIKFIYHDKKEDRISNRTIDPLLIVYYTNHWNVIGYCHTRKSPRNFLLNRMKDISISSESVQNKTNYLPEELLYDTSQNQYLISIIVNNKINEAFLSSLPSLVQKKEQINTNQTRYQFLFDNLDYISEWLLRFSNNIAVESPGELIDKRKALLTELINSL